jgi:hypothetical protein
MTYNLFIDDERSPPNDGLSWSVVRSSEQAKMLVLKMGLPAYISFDHDLGGDDTSMEFLHWLIDYMLANHLSFPEGFAYYVHSQNPIGRQNIEGLLDNFLKHLES